jgi:hypothetical protein
VIGRGTRRAAIGGMLAVLALAGCAGQTNRPTSVGTTTATLTGERGCAADVDGRWAWQWRKLGSAGWSSGGASQLNCPPDQRSDLSGYQGGPSAPLSHSLTGLTPDTTYQFRLLVDPRDPCDLRAPATCGDVYHVDSAGTPNGTSYDTATTQPACDDIQGSSESLAAFVAANGAGTAADPKILCLRQGTQSIGQLNGLKAWSTLTPRGEADGTKQPVVLEGNIALENRGATVEDVKIVGCHAQSGCSTDRDKAVDMRADDVAIRHVEVTQRGGRNAARLQCVMINSGVQVKGARVEHSKVHSCGSEGSGNKDHGIYCSNATGAIIAGNWFYDNEGYGVHLYPNCDNALAVGNVVAENGASCVVSGDSSATSSQTAYVAGFCGFAREAGHPPIHCGPTSANQAIDMVLYDPRASVTDCSSAELRPTGTLNADPQFVNRGGYDFRARNPFARAKLGVYADIVPGPRW